MTEKRFHTLSQSEQASVLYRQNIYLLTRGWQISTKGPLGPDYVKDPQTKRVYHTTRATAIQMGRDGLMTGDVSSWNIATTVIAPVKCTRIVAPNGATCKNWAVPDETGPLCPGCGGKRAKAHIAPGTLLKKLAVKKTPKKVSNSNVAKITNLKTGESMPLPQAFKVGQQKRSELLGLGVTGLEDYSNEELAWAQLNCSPQDAKGAEASAVLNFLAPGSAHVNIGGTLTSFKASKVKYELPGGKSLNLGPAELLMELPKDKPKKKNSGSLESDPTGTTLMNNWDEWE